MRPVLIDRVKRLGLAPGLAAVVAASVLTGCDDEAGDLCDDAAGCTAQPDAGVSPPPVPWLADGLPPMASPALTPCPDGWREVPPPAAGDPATCTPYPGDEPLECTAGRAHFVGEPACAPVGSACPAGDFADGLPTDTPVVYVQPGSTGGDGSAAMPFATPADVDFDSLPDGAVIALAKGTHDGPVAISRAHVLVGACAEETIVQVAAPSETDAVITLGGAGVLEDLSVSDSPRPGIRLGDGEGRLQGVAVERTGAVGIEVVRSAHLTGDGVLIASSTGTSTGEFGRGFEVVGASAELRRASLVRTRDAAVFASEAGTSLALTDVVLRNTRSQGVDGIGGRGISVQLGVTLDLTRTLVTHNREVGIFVGGIGTTMTLRDAVVRDTDSQAAGAPLGRGLSVVGGATATIERAVLARNRDGAVTASLAGAAVTLADAVVRDTESLEGDGRFGRGLGLQLGATAEVRRTHFVDNREVGVYASDRETMLMLADVVVRDTRSREGLGTAGRGVNVQLEAQLMAMNVVVSRNREVGVAIFGGATASFEDAVVSETLARDCETTTCPESGGSHGVGSYDSGSAIEMTGFLVHGADLCGLQLANGGEVDLDSGQVSSNTIGACVQNDDYDTSRLTNRVLYADNETNLQATDLPVPETITAVP